LQQKHKQFIQFNFFETSLTGGFTPSAGEGRVVIAAKTKNQSLTD
jgi:hypothetical protein